MNDSRFSKMTERGLINKTSIERDGLLKAKNLIEEMKTLYDIFGSPTLIHMKFANLQIYAIKRLNYLVFNLDDFNSEGGGKNLKYQDIFWNDSLPSDPELISSIFCHLLDIAYYGSKQYDYKNTINHLINSSQTSCIHYLSDD